MYNVELIPLIEAYQQGNRQEFEKIYSVFEKLIAYYARRFQHDEDALQEFNVFLIEILYQIPLDRFCMDKSRGLQKYISVSIRNQYIFYSKCKQKNDAMFVGFCEPIAGYQSSEDQRLMLLEGLSLLPDKQKRVIVDKYVYGYSDAEIAENLHISRQAVNRLKSRGLSALKAFFEKE